MKGRLGLILKSAAAIVGAVGIVALARPLLQPHLSSDAQRALATEYSLADNGYGYCAENLPGVDCACFAKTAGQVLDSQRTRASGWSYMDPWDLAKTQATRSC